MAGGFGLLLRYGRTSTTMKCLVTGATGFIGTELCLQLEHRGASLQRVGREPPTDQQLADVDIIFYCAGLAHQDASAAQHEQANYRSVLELARRALSAGVQRFVFLSSVKAGPGEGAYGYWKWRAEQALVAEFADSSLRPVILRPALVYGAGARANLHSLLRAVQLGLPTPPAGTPRSMVGLPDLCSAMCQCLEIDPGSVPFAVTDGQSYDLQRLHSAIARGLGKTPGRAWLPRWCWWLACAALDLFKGPGERSWQKLFAGEEVSNLPVCAALQWQPVQTFEDLVPAMLQETR
jgi:nucleoside-diphosphate-sugar epimerase